MSAASLLFALSCLLLLSWMLLLGSGLGPVVSMLLLVA
jgi:hypothetical protein